jgi:large subunit ribosomal protein L32
MSVPKQKTPKSKTRKRQYKNRLKNIFLSICPQCKKPIRSHHACSFCGTYKGREIIKTKETKKQEKTKETKKQEIA